MSLYITEHSNAQRLHTMGAPLTLAAIAAYNLTSAAVATPSTNAQYLRVSADAGSFLGVILSTVTNPQSILGSSTATLTSTNAFRVPANQTPELFAIPPGAKLVCAST